MLWSLLAVTLFAGLEAWQPSPAGAARPSNITFSQTCNGERVDVNISWVGDPSAREIWIDLSKVDDGFQNIIASAGPLPGRTATYQWRGLEQHTTYFWRVNQLMPSGSWEPTAVRYLTACGNVAARPGTRIELLGFSDKVDSPVSSLTSVGGRLRACNPTRLYAYVRVGSSSGNRGDSEIIDGTLLWYQGTTLIARLPLAIDVDAAVNVQIFLVGRAAGYPEGPYSFQLWTGGDGTWKQNASGDFTLAC
jgi:hypothetical protein